MALLAWFGFDLFGRGRALSGGCAADNEAVTVRLVGSGGCRGSGGDSAEAEAGG